jgi:hypothetical protein
MATALSGWIGKKATSLRKKNAFKKTDKPPPLPILPQVRPRVLTPASSTTFLTGHAPAVDASAQSSLFRRLPYELRRKILIEAFGEQVVHLHLFLGGHEGKDKGDKEAIRHSHANLIPPRKRDLESASLTWNHNKWCWHGSVCHRGAPTSMSKGVWKLAECHCLDGDSTMCEFWAGEIPGKCFIGIMGWLLSCRQAFVHPYFGIISTRP